MRSKLIILSLMYVIFVTSSCSSRRVNKSEVKEKTEVSTVDSTKTETKTEINNVLIDTTSTTEIEVTPIDNTKPIIINGKSYTNVKIKTRKVKNGVIITNEKKVAQIEQKAVKTNSTAVKTVVAKETERKPDYSWWWLLLFLIPAYFIFRRKISLFNYF